MKNLLIIFCLSLLSFTSFSQQNSSFDKNKSTILEFMDSYNGKDGVTKVEIGKVMIQNIAKNLEKSGNKKNAELLSSIESINMLIDAGEEAKIQRRMFELPELCKRYELISTVEKKGDKSEFHFASHKDNDKCEFLMLVESNEKDLILYITGKFSIQDISALSGFSKGV